jgi:hypothetical protein
MDEKWSEAFIWQEVGEIYEPLGLSWHASLGRGA